MRKSRFTSQEKPAEHKARIEMLEFQMAIEAANLQAGEDLALNQNVLNFSIIKYCGYTDQCLQHVGQ